MLVQATLETDTWNGNMKDCTTTNDLTRKSERRKSFALKVRSAAWNYYASLNYSNNFKESPPLKCGVALCFWARTSHQSPPSFTILPMQKSIFNHSVPATNSKRSKDGIWIRYIARNGMGSSPQRIASPPFSIS